MNSVSLVLWASDVVGNIQPALGISGTLLIILGALALAASIIGKFGGFSYDEKDNELAAKIFGKGAKVMLSLGIPFILVATLIPSSGTVRLIAVSEFTEEFANTPTGSEIGGLVQDTITVLRQSISSMVEKE